MRLLLPYSCIWCLEEAFDKKDGFVCDTEDGVNWSLFIALMLVASSLTAVHMGWAGGCQYDRYIAISTLAPMTALGTVTGCTHFLDSKMRLAST